MKHIFVIFFGSLFLSYSGFGQHYEPFISKTKQWKYVQTLYLTKKSTQALYLVTLGNFNGDTTINNIKYSKLYNKNIYQYNAKPDTTVNLLYCFYEDTINKKVFVYDFHYNKSALLYDFALNKGDTVKTYVLSNIYHKHTVIHVDTVFTMNNKLKRILLNDSTIWLESIGSITKNHIPSAGDLICVKENNSVLFLNEKFNNCDTIFRQNPNNAINEITHNKKEYDISLFPHPIENSSVLRVSINDNRLLKIEIFNCLGTLVKFDYFKDSYAIGLVQLTKGLYFYRIADKNELIGTGKIIVN